MQVLIVKYNGIIRREDQFEELKRNIRNQIIEENFLLLDGRYEYSVEEIDNLIVKENSNE